MRKIILVTLVASAGLMISPVFGQSVSQIIAHASSITPTPSSAHSATIDSTATVDPGATVDATATVTGGATVNAGVTQDAGATVEATTGFNIWSPAPLPSPPRSYSAARTAIPPYKLKH
ncbi:MAG: hypothetical protein ABI114_09230 [Rhodanobacter sp.]